MDVSWFKQQQKRAGVTAEDIAARLGRARSNVSHIYNGQQRMSLEWAQAFSDALGVPLDEVLRRAGALPESRTVTAQPGFGEGDAAPWTPAQPDRQRIEARANAMGSRPGVDVWQVAGNALALNGMLPGDFFLLDTHRAERARAGEVVVVQHYDYQTGGAVTLLRRFEPPVLVAASLDPAERRVLVADGRNVVIRGVVVACWRDMTN